MMRLFAHVFAALTIILPISALAQTVTNAPVNLAPNSQWEIMSAWGFDTQEAYQGTGTVAPITASANTTGSIGRSTFTVTTTGALSVGDLIYINGTPADPCFNISPMRIVALTANAAITVRLPLGCTPSTSGSTPLLPVTARPKTGDGNGPDGWQRSTDLLMWRNENRGAYAANMPNDTVGAYAALGMTKGISSREVLRIDFPPQHLAKFLGKTVSFGIYGYQKVRGGSGTWTVYANDTSSGLRPCAAASTNSSYQWIECSFVINPAATNLEIGVELNGNAADTYYFVNPVLTIGTAIGGVGNYQKPQGETVNVVAHITPKGWEDSAVTFPADRASYCGSNIVTCFEHDLYAETGGLIAPTVVNCQGQLEGINAGALVVGSAYTRVMSWFDELTSGQQKSGSFLPQYASNVKSYSYMDFPLNQKITGPGDLGTGIYGSNVLSDHWGNVSEEIDRCQLN